MISVSLCTYNGEQFIRKQIESILNQTRKVDEIVVCDDCSSDNTISILQQLSSKYPNVIRLFQNDQQLGVFENFMKAVCLCSGDIIFLSDQDDIWHTDKVEVMANYLNHHPKIDLVFSDAQLLGGDFNGQSMSDNLNFPKENRKMFKAGLAFELSLYQVYALGASMAIRRRLLDHVQLSNPIIKSHDHLLQIVSSSHDAIAYIDKQLYDYRLHNHQTSNAGTKLVQIHMSIVIPQNGEVWPLPAFEKTLTDQRQRERYGYMAERNQLLHDIFGPIKVLLRPIKYIRLYKNNAFRVMQYDISRSIQKSLMRINQRLHT